MTKVASASDTSVSTRRIVYRTGGQRHGPITRLVSPGDLGRHMKPFVFLDLFGGNTLLRKGGMGLHPHSGIGTVTVVTDGDMTFNDFKDGRGTIAYGGVEWMRAGGGVWHGNELSAGASDSTTGYQLWITLPPELENAPPQSQYLEASAIPRVGPARIILGQHGGPQSPVQSPDGINYLLVTLAPGERWRYVPPVGHRVGWVSVSHGDLAGQIDVRAGEVALLDDSDGEIDLEGGAEGARLVLGSAIPFPYDLHMGSHSVHTSGETLRSGERRILELRSMILEQERSGIGVGNRPFTGS